MIFAVPYQNDDVFLHRAERDNMILNQPPGLHLISVSLKFGWDVLRTDNFIH